MNANKIAGLLRQQIDSGRFAPGEQLPCQRELGRMFCVARGTIHAALRQLESQGYISREPRRGTFVSDRADDQVAEISALAGPMALIEARMALEPHMARLAAEHASEIDLMELEGSHLWGEPEGVDTTRFVAQEEHFHLALARCTRNPLIFSMMTMLQRAAGNARRNGAPGRSSAGPEHAARHIRQHQAIADAIRAGDAEQASHLMRQHIDAARRALLQEQHRSEIAAG